MLSVEQALELILERASPLPAERTALDDATGLSLAEDIVADIDLPPFDNSAVDGYAVRSVDVAAAPVLLRCVGESHAGNPSAVEVTARTAVRIMTGAPLPAGADAVVMVEDTLQPSGDLVEIRELARPEQFVRRRGEDIKSGEVVVHSGCMLGAAEIAVAAAMGRPVVSTIARPRVAIVTTGDEVDDLLDGTPPRFGRIRNSNRYALAALVREAGAIVRSTRHVPDDADATDRALRECADPVSGADVIVSAGGVSMGDRDYVRPAVQRLGTLDLWKVRMKPGKPLAFGIIGSTLFFGLPGNPVSAMVTFELFVRPALMKLAGRSGGELGRRHLTATLTQSLQHTPGRTEFVRAITSMDFPPTTRPSGLQGSGMLSSMLHANSLIVVPEGITGLDAGEQVDVMLIR